MRFKSLVDGNVTKLIGKKIMHTHVFHDHRRGLGELALIGKQDDRGRVMLRLFDKPLMIVFGLIPWPEIIPTRWIVTVAQKIKHRLVRKREDRLRSGSKFLDTSDELSNLFRLLY